jgi:hypothetical protein
MPLIREASLDEVDVEMSVTSVDTSNPATRKRQKGGYSS